MDQLFSTALLEDWNKNPLLINFVEYILIKILVYIYYYAFFSYLDPGCYELTKKTKEPTTETPIPVVDTR